VKGNWVNESFLWFKATRPKTLVASVIPVALSGCSFWGKNDQLSWIIMGGCLLFSFLIQIGCNFANDYYDFIRGSDQNRSLAPQRLVAAGQIDSSTMKLASWGILTLAFVIGSITWYLVDAPGWFLLFGLSSVLFAIFYTGGPFPLAYNGLGDLFVILYFGFGAVEGTNFLLSLASGLEYHSTWELSLGTGLIINNLLVVNNYRDYETDKAVNKRTLVVIFGKKFAIIQFLAGLIYTSVILPSVFDLSYWNLLVLLPAVPSLIVLLNSEKKAHYEISLALASFSVIAFSSVNCVIFLSGH
jgi:1,4-dihydroxy-2-naphthoate octaprenyltransferase